MAKQDERQRMKLRLQEYAVELATKNQWNEVIEINRQILLLGEDPETYNRLGKAFFELGSYSESYEHYQQTLRISPTNVIARKNLARLEVMMTRGLDQFRPTSNNREQVDMLLFVTEAGKAVISTLIETPRSPAVESLTVGEKIALVQEGEYVLATDTDGNVIGRLEPRLAKRYIELVKRGNQFVTAVAQCDTRQVRLLIRETYQHPDQRDKISLPVKFSEISPYGQVTSMNYSYDVEELLDDDIADVTDDSDDDFAGSRDDREVGLDEIEKDISAEEEETEE